MFFLGGNTPWESSLPAYSLFAAVPISGPSSNMNMDDDQPPELIDEEQPPELVDADEIPEDDEKLVKVPITIVTGKSS